VVALDLIAFSLTIAASAIPALSGALKSYLARKSRMAIVKETLASSVTLTTAASRADDIHVEELLQKTRRRGAEKPLEQATGVPSPIAPAAAAPGRALDATREILASAPAPSHMVRSRTSVRVATWISVVVGLLVVLASIYFVRGRPEQPVQHAVEGPPAISSVEKSPLPEQAQPRLVATWIWLTEHEFFYHLLFLLAVLSIVLLNKRRLIALASRLDASGQLLLAFACVVFYFGGSAAIHYWQRMYLTADKFYLALGLFFTMVGGMFVQVITANYKAGAASLFAVTTAQLIYPVLFSPIVYYSIWAVASASASAGLFSFYAAFLNGYFWQSVVTSAQKASTVAAV
jgi:hypothetical protein